MSSASLQADWLRASPKTAHPGAKAGSSKFGTLPIQRNKSVALKIWWELAIYQMDLSQRFKWAGDLGRNLWTIELSLLDCIRVKRLLSGLAAGNSEDAPEYCDCCGIASVSKLLCERTICRRRRKQSIPRQKLTHRDLGRCEI